MRALRLSLLGLLVASPAVAQEAAEPAVTAEPIAEPAVDWSDPALADDTTESLQIHGWVSQGFLASVRNNYLAHSTRGSFEFFETGLNVTKELGSELRAGVQVFAQDLGPTGNFRPLVDWAYVDWHKRPEFGVRAGKFKMPLYLYNERMDADMTRTTALMPQSVYDQHFRDILNSVVGVGVYGTLDLGGAGSLDYDVYGGTVLITFADAEWDMEHVAGTRVTWDVPSCLRVSAHGLYTNFSATRQVDAMTTIKQEYENWMMVGGALECALDAWTFTAEAGIWDARVVTTPEVAPAFDFRELRAYAQAEHRINDRTSAAAYLSAYASMDDWSPSSEDGLHQYDLALALRYDVTANWLVKAEIHGIDGWGLTEADLNAGRELKDNWGMFVAKTTLTF
jgi:hypothetical protein